MAFTDTKPSTRRSSIKSRRLHWKQKLRENCLQRVEKNRSQILWKLRLGGDVLPISQEAAKVTFSGILEDEIERLRPRTSCDTFHAQPDNDVKIWEYEPPVALSELGNDEYEELMIAMQNILHEDLLIENDKRDRLLLEDFENMCEQEDHTIFNMLEQLRIAESNGIICPICKCGKLQQNQHLIFCSCGHFRLDVQHEKVTLEVLRRRLEEVLQQHHDLGCKGQPLFCTDHRFSITALYMQCNVCEAFELVL